MSEYETRVNPTYQSSSTTTDGSLSIDTTNRSSVTTSNLSSLLPEKFKYSLGDDFTFEGSDYIGYFNVLKGVPYKGRDKQEEILASKGNISSIIELSNDYFDRTKTQNLDFKIGLDDILFQPNEIINKNSINNKIELLYENFKELFKYSKIANSNIPRNFTAFAQVTALSAEFKSDFSTITSFTPEVKWNGAKDLILSASSFLDLSLGNINPVLSGQRRLFETLQGPLNDKLTLFLAVSNSLFSFDLDKTDKQVLSSNTFNFITSTTNVGEFENFKFKDIVSIDSNNENTLYISDSGHNSIFKLEVDSITNRDRTGIRNFLLTDVIGNSGTDETNFAQVDDLTYGDEYIYVYDKNAKSIKKFTKDFNFVSKYTNVKYFTDNNFVSINYNKNNRNLYILSPNFRVLVLTSTTFQKVDEYIFDGTEVNTHYPVKLLFSRNNSNVYYLLTNFGVHKYFLSTKNKSIGSFFVRNDFETVQHWESTEEAFDGTSKLWDELPLNTGFLGHDMNLIESPFNFDMIYALSRNTFLEFLEDNNYRTFLNNENPTFINLDDILIKEDYFNNITFNNLIYKYLHNINILGNNINERITLKYKENVLSIDKFIPLTPDEKVNQLRIDNIKDFYVGMNETTSTLVFNRVFKNLYNYQSKIASIINSTTVNTEISPLTTITF